ncbi:MBL fold metallo-hydrolase [Nocardia sp. NPDC127579]|uniref:MBL fold metallo-hydrolase n=1 Tax=Nocardia sp. NPDC127579 TaxID=3345402 RepID=UPI00363B3D31
MPIPFTRGLHRLGAGAFAYLEPDGSWGRSNAGLVTDGDEALLIDTLFTLSQTAHLLRSVSDELPEVTIRTLVNTHDDPDHWWGNQLVVGAEIVSSAAAARQMSENRFLAMLLDEKLPAGLRDWMAPIVAEFDFTGVEPTLPTRTFSEALEIRVGRRSVQLLEAGPAHTHGDVLAHLPDAGILFAGDLLFAGIHPVIHSGPIDGWIAACEIILDLDAHTIVPGHGPVVGPAYVRLFGEYLRRLRDYAHRCHATGRTVSEAARGFDFTRCQNLLGPERVLLDIGAVYRECGSAITEPELLGMLPEFAATLTAASDSGVVANSRTGGWSAE